MLYIYRTHIWSLGLSEHRECIRYILNLWSFWTRENDDRWSSPMRWPSWLATWWPKRWRRNWFSLVPMSSRPGSSSKIMQDSCDSPPNRCWTGQNERLHFSIVFFFWILLLVLFDLFHLVFWGYQNYGCWMLDAAGDHQVGIGPGSVCTTRKQTGAKNATGSGHPRQGWH